MSRQKDDPFASFTLGDDVQTGEFPVVGTHQNAAVTAIQPPPRRRPRTQRGQSARSHASSIQPQVVSQGQVQGHQVQQPDPRDQQLALLQEQNALLQQQMAAQTSALQQLQQQVAAQSGGGSQPYSPAPARSEQVSQTYEPQISSVQAEEKESKLTLSAEDRKQIRKNLLAATKEYPKLHKVAKADARKTQKAAKAIMAIGRDWEDKLELYLEAEGREDELESIVEMIEEREEFLLLVKEAEEARKDAPGLTGWLKGLYIFFWVVYILLGVVYAGAAHAVVGGLGLVATIWPDLFMSGWQPFWKGLTLGVIVPILAVILSIAVKENNSSGPSLYSYFSQKYSWFSFFLGESKKTSQPPAGDQNVAPRRGAPVGAPPGGSVKIAPRTSPSRRPTVRRRTRRRRVVRRRRVRRRRRARRRISMRWQRNVLIRSGHWRNIGMSRKRMHTICVKAGRVSRIYVQSGGANVSVVQPTRTPGCRQSFVVVARKYGTVQVGVQGSFPVKLRLSK